MMMGMNKKMLTLVAGTALATLVMGSGGCANQAGYDSLMETSRAQSETIERLQRELKEREAELATLQRTGAARESALSEATRARDDAQARLAAALRKLDEFGGRLSGLNLSPLDQDTDRALADLAGKYSGLVEYDKAKGMLRFNSDLTFDSGQDVVKDSAKQSLNALADILNSSSAQNYEVMIVGHTDSQPVSSGTASRGHPTNMHLSCHRAIAVRDALKGLNVPSGRMFASGWGEERPRVPNTGNGNTPANRRVEIFLTRSTAGLTTSNANTATPPVVPVDRATNPTRQPDMTK
jgi:chemotaxis protein MotB